MKIIKTKVIGDTITPIEQGYVIENQVNQYAIEFDFDETWNFEEKYCIFQDEFEEQTFKRAIINNQVIVPSELLNGRITIQVYGQNIENDVITNRQPSLKYVFSILNSLPTNASEEQNVPTPTQWELYIEQIEEMCNDLQDKFDDLKEDCETKCNDVIERLAQDEQDIQTNTDNIRTNAEAIDKLNTDLLDYSLITETGNKISMSINPKTYVITLSLKDKNDNVLSTQSVDLPLETMIVSASYSNGILTFTLKNGQTLQVPISDLISGLVSTDTFNQAVQGLSNRITTIENDYLKSTDKTELQNQITANADDISDIKGEQLTQNADIESLQQENERLQRIVSGLPTKNASGTNIVLNDMVNCEIKEISLKGDTIQNGTPTPDTPIAIQSVTGNQTVQFSGKNIFKPYSTGTIEVNNLNITVDENYNIKLNGTTNARSYIEIGYKYGSGTNSQNKPIIPINNEKITISTHYFKGQVNGEPYITTQYTQNSSINTIVRTNDNSNVVNNSTGIYRLYIVIPENCAFTNFEFGIQLEKGDTSTSFEQYSGTQFPISLGTIELNKIGDYQDKIYKQNDKWYLEKNVEKVILNGSETWNSESAYGGYTRYNNVNDIISEVINDNNGYNNYFIQRVNQAHGGYNYLYLQPSTRNIHIQIDENICSDVDEFKEWLSTHNTIVYYILSTQVITEITDENLISQLEALNNYILLTNNTIISNGNLPVINDITGYVDIMSLLSTQNNRSVVEEKKSKPIKEPIEEPIETKEEER